MCAVPESWGSGTAVWKAGALRVPSRSVLPREGRVRCGRVTELLSPASVEPLGARITMFRFMRDVEPEDPMFLM